MTDAAGVPLHMVAAGANPKLRRYTERRATGVDFSLFLAAAFVVTCILIERARSRYC